MASRVGRVQSVERALDVLEVLGTNARGMGITEIGRAIGLPYATIHRLIATLVARGYVHQDPETRRYLLGPRLVGLGSTASKLFGGVVQPYLEQIVEATGETANMAVLEDGYVVYVAQASSHRMVRMFTEVGNRVLPHRTAVGKVLLARQPRDYVIRMLKRNGLPAATPNSITDLDEMLAELDRAQAQGYAADVEEQELGVSCVAVPIQSATGIAAAVSVSGPTSRISDAERASFVHHLERGAAMIGKMLDDTDQP